VDEVLKQAFETADYMSVLASQKRILKEEFYQNLIYYKNGGTFTVTKELINFVKTLDDLKHSSEIVIIDNNDIPILIESAQDFLQDLLSVYSFATNSYYNKFSDLKKSRTIEKLVNYDK
jgi:hypothetical protein